MAKLFDVDDFWDSIGRYGKYQRRQMLITIIATLPAAFHIVSVVFIGSNPSHRCAEGPSNNSLLKESGIVNVTYEECHIEWHHTLDNSSLYTKKTGCMYGYNISQPSKYSFSTEWNLFCEDDVWIKTSQTLVIGGMFLGAFASPLADKFGRKLVQIVSNIGLFVVAISMAFMTNFNGFLVLRFVVGAFQQGMLLTSTTLWLEILHTHDRVAVAVLIVMLWGLSALVLAMLSYILRGYGWRIIQLALSLFSSVAFLEIFFVDESLRWLIANNRNSQAIALIKKASKMNGVTIDEKSIYFGNEDQELIVKSPSSETPESPDKTTKDSIPQQTSQKQMPWTTLLTDRILRKHSLIVWTCWLVNVLVYYGIVLMTPGFFGNVYLNFSCGCIAELVGGVTMVFLFKSFERTTVLKIYQMTVGVGLVVNIITSFFSGHALRIIETAIFMICRGSIMCSFTGLFLCSPELFPTNLRNAGLGISSAVGRIAGMIAPFSAYTLSVGMWLPCAIFGGLSLLSAYLLRFLPHTKHRELPQTIEEIYAWQSDEEYKKVGKPS